MVGAVSATGPVLARCTGCIAGRSTLHCVQQRLTSSCQCLIMHQPPVKVTGQACEASRGKGLVSLRGEQDAIMLCNLPFTWRQARSQPDLSADSSVYPKQEPERLGLASSRLLSVRTRTCVQIGLRHVSCSCLALQHSRLMIMQHMLVTEAVPGASPRNRARMAVEYMEPAADSVVAEKISGACRTIRSFCPKILKPKDRMTTPSMLMSQFPAPHTSGLCTQQLLVSRHLAHHPAFLPGSALHFRDKKTAASNMSRWSG